MGGVKTRPKSLFALREIRSSETYLSLISRGDGEDGKGVDDRKIAIADFRGEGLVQKMGDSLGSRDRMDPRFSF
ncbi:MAG: hypothetical protein CMI32_07700 [Opitutales bacterium]|nr:hypothetical protein [Opitutales bacterium]